VSRRLPEQELLVSEPPDAVLRRFVVAANGLDGTLSSPVPGTLVLTRTYRPAAAWVVAILGAVVLIGLLALLVTYTDTITIAVEKAGSGTRITLVGTGTRQAVARIEGVVAALA